MNRREWLKTTAAGSAAALAGLQLNAAESTKPQAKTTGRNQISTDIKRVMLRHTWTTVMSSSEYRDVFRVRWARDGFTGRGEGAPIIRYKESAETARAAVESIRSYLAGADPRQYQKVMAEIFRRVPGEWASKAAIDIALMDWVGQKLGVPVYGLLGLDPNDTPTTTFSIGIDTPETTRQKLAEAEQFPVLKIKVGLDSDEATMETVRRFTKKPLRVDANEGWKTKEEAVRKINWLETMGVEFVEQPMRADMLEEMRWVHSRVHIPIIADEACLHAPDIPKLVGAYDGVNIKLDKAGGILEAYKMIQMARSLGLKIQLGCMISSSISVTAAAHLSPLVDYADLDGNLLIANDDFSGVKVEKGKLVLPNRPGLGLLPIKTRA